MIKHTVASRRLLRGAAPLLSLVPPASKIKGALHSFARPHPRQLFTSPLLDSCSFFRDLSRPLSSFTAAGLRPSRATTVLLCRRFGTGRDAKNSPPPPPTTTTSTMATSITTTTTTSGTQPITADAMLRLFPDIDTTSAALTGHDEEQIRLMDEVCIVLDENDVPIGKASKKICHLMTNIDKGLLHRAFSVFLFNKRNELLLQQRAAEKITFPGMWTNTCCSHPLGIPGETGTGLVDAVEGVKRAAQRKLGHELGIASEQVPLERFHFLTRIHYKAPSDGQWGEHEIDYILFIKADVDLDPSPNEVQATQYVGPERLRQLFEDPDLSFTPWFKLICNSFLFEWWASLDSGLEKYMNEEKIHRM